MRLPFLHSILAATTLAQRCYYPDGSVVVGDTPCSSQGDSHCCARSGACLDNGYCFDLGTTGPIGLYRGSCTDRNWGSSCPQRCIGGNDFPNLGARVARWRLNGTVWLYCCVGSDYDNTDYDSACADGGTPFMLPSASFLYGYAALASAEIVSPASSTPTPTPTAATAASGDSTGTCNKRTSTAQVAAVAAAAAGVAVALGVVSAAAATWAIWERRQRKRMVRDGSAHPKASLDSAGGPWNTSTPEASTPAYVADASVPAAHDAAAPPLELALNEPQLELPGSFASARDI